MSDPTLVVTIDCSGISQPDVVLRGTRSGSFGIIKYIPPAMVPRYAYAPDAPGIDGSELVDAPWGQGILGVDWIPLGAADEADVQTGYSTVLAAISQFEFPVTTQVNGAPAQVWSGQRGSMQLGGSDGRTYVDLVTRTPIYALSIPVFPIPGAP